MPYNSSDQRKAVINAKIAHSEESLKRNPHTDYTSGYFFITVTVREHKPLLGAITGHIDYHTHQAIDPGVRLTALGEKVQNCWQHIPEIYPNVQIIDAIVMPEHFHGLLHLDFSQDTHLETIVNGFKTDCNREYKEIYPLHTACLFTEDHNDTIPITADEVATKQTYIHDNPTRRLIKGELPNCFTIHRAQSSQNWTLSRIMQGLRADHFLASHPDALELSFDTIKDRLLMSADKYYLDYLGPHKLLAAKTKFPLICHRADVDKFNLQAAAVMDAAHNGAVIVSAFISPNEREILKQLIAEGLPTIEIIDKGMGKTYKPWGQSFYACAESRLLQITCWTYKYEKVPQPITRAQCMVMNELARLISGQSDDWWLKWQ